MRFITLLALCLSAFAGQVTLKNGDRLTGEIVEVDGKTLLIKTEFAGDVTIKWEAVAAVQSEKPLHLALGDNQTVVGTVTTEEQKITVTTKAAGTVTTTKESVKSIRSEARQTAYEAEIARYRNPRLVDLWTGFVDLGFSQARGNAETTSLTTSANASRATSRDKIRVYFTSIRSKSEVNNRQLDTANAMRGGIGYELNVSKKVFVFGSTDLEYDQFQSLDLRFAPSGGFGYHVVKTEASQFDIFGGAGLNREFFSTGLNRTSGEILFGEEWNAKLNKTFAIHEKLSILPNMSDAGSFRVNFDTALVTTLKKWLSWQFTVSDRYLSNPIFGRKKNDALISTGVRLTFAK